MDEPLAIGPTGFPVQPGSVYRFTAWLPSSAFHALPWNTPGDADIVAAVRAAGWPDAVLTMPWDAVPADWPAESGLPPDGFVVRGQGTWGGAGNAVPAAWPMSKGGDLHVALVWKHAGEQPSPAPDPGQSPEPQPPAPSPRPWPHPPRPVPAPSGGGPAPGRRRSGLALGGVLALGVAVLLAHSHGR